MSSPTAQQFHLLAKSIRSLAAADLVTRVLEHPDILKNTLKQNHSLLLSTLKLFAYGILSDYDLQRSRFISLSQQLQTGSMRELEDLIIGGKLDQLNSRLNIEYAIARDINSTAVNRVEDVLD